MLPTILVHGARYDPMGPDRQNPHRTIYKKWGEEIPGKVIPFSWFSAPHTFRNYLCSWVHGYATPWYWAWNLAYPASNRLHAVIQDTGECNIFCHSMGARVVLNTLARGFPQVKNVIILNGAEFVGTAKIVAGSTPYTNYWNFMSDDDRPLSWLHRLIRGEDFIGQRGILENTPCNWWDKTLDCSDHSCSHQNPHNWNLYRSILQPDR